MLGLFGGRESSFPIERIQWIILDANSNNTDKLTVLQRGTQYNKPPDIHPNPQLIDNDEIN